MLDKEKNHLNYYQLQDQQSLMTSFTQKGRKLEALSEKILKDKLPIYNEGFNKYVQQIEKNLFQNKSQQDMRKRSISKHKVKRNKRIQKQLQLPFEMYIYSSCDSQRQQNNFPLRIQGSSSSQKQQSSQQKWTIQKGRQKMQNKIFSFAKNNRRKIDMQKNILDELNKQQQCEMLERLLDSVKVNQMVERYTNIYMDSLDGSDLYNKGKQQVLLSKLGKIVTQQLTQTLSPYYLNLQTQLIDQISNKYLQRVYIPIQEQKMDEMIYFRKQQLQIKNNQLTTLQSILKEIKNNQHIQRIINFKSFRPNRSEMEQQQFYDTQIQGKNKNIDKNNRQVNKVNMNRVPSLAINQIKKSTNLQLKSKSNKPLTQRQQNNQSITQRSLNPPRSKPGRIYQYQNNKSIKSSKQQSQSYIVDNNNDKLREQRQSSSRYSKQRRQSKQKQISKITKRKSMRRQQQKEEKVYKTNQLLPIEKGNNLNHQNRQVRIQQQVSFKQLLQKFRNNQSKQRYINPQSIGLLQLKKLQLDQQYKENIQAVTTFQIQHLKTQLDRVNSQLSQLKQQYEDRYKSIQLNNRIQYLNSKQQTIKKKLKHKIKLFWKYAHTQIIKQPQSISI